METGGRIKPARVSAAYRRIILKLSGEHLGGGGGEPIASPRLRETARKLAEARESGVEIGIVCGGGNIIRGKLARDLDVERVTADQMGMLSTVVNGLALRDALEKSGTKARLFSCLEVGSLAESYSPRRAAETLKEGEIAIFSGGTGNPFVSTDTAAVLRACDVNAGAVLKATKVDGIYSADPVKDAGARRFDEISYEKALSLELGIMDLPAVALARDYKVPVLVFNFLEEGSLTRIIAGEKLGTIMK